MSSDVLLHQTCRCGGEMIIHMHTLIYKAKVRISGVPVFMCQSCFSYEPHPAVKHDLSLLLEELGDTPKRTRLAFPERNEWAYVMSEAFKGDSGEFFNLDQAVQREAAARIDLLLDTLRFASESGDKEWMDDIGKRLRVFVPHSTQKVT